MTNDLLAKLESEIGAPLPDDYRILASACGGIEDIGIEVDFSGFVNSWAHEAVPHGLAFAHDGCGNYWVVDCDPNGSDESHIFYACHDAPVVLYQGTGLAEFLNQLYLYDIEDRTSDIWGVFEDSRFDVWRTNPGLIPYEQALRSNDPVIREFADSLDERYFVIDLRDVPPGMGFSWGRRGFGEVVRFGDERIFCVREVNREVRSDEEAVRGRLTS